MVQGAGFSIEGYVIVSADGMLGKGDRQMPDELKFDADKAFFSAALDQADLVVHGRFSQEDHPNSARRRRLILTRQISAVEPHPGNPRAMLWNPDGMGFEAACQVAGLTSGRIAIIGGPAVFDLFMDRYDTFWLSEAPRVRLPEGEPCFGGVPARSPQQVLADHGLVPGERQMLDRAADISVTPWRRAQGAKSR